MTIRAKTIAAVAATLAVLVGVLYLALGWLLAEGFGSVEREDARKNVLRVLDAVNAELAGVEGTASTNAHWDDAYDFVRNRTPDFVATNIGEPWFVGTNNNYSAYLDLEGNVLYAGGFDLQAVKAAPVPPALTALFRKDSPLLAAAATGEVVKGILVLDGDPVMVVSVPVTDSAGTQPPKGVCIFARRIDQVTTRRISETTHLAVSFQVGTTDLPQPEISERSADRLEGRVTLRDLHGRPALLARVDLARPIHDQGRHTLAYAVGAVALVGVVFGIVMLLLLETLVLRRVVRLNRDVRSISEKLDFSQQVRAGGKDEISSLATSINGMVSAVSELMSALPDEGGKK